MDDLDDDTKKIMLRQALGGIYWYRSEVVEEALRVALLDLGIVTWTDRSAEDIGHESHVSVEELSDDPPPLIDSTTGEIIS